MVLAVLARYYVLCRPQIQRLCFPTHRDGRSTRKHLSKLLHGRHLSKHSAMVPYPVNGSGCPCYYLTQRGAELLASYHDDPRYKSVNCKTPRADMLLHWLAVNDTRLSIEAAVAQNPEIKLLQWFSEWQTIFNDDGQEQFYLHTVFQTNLPLSCSPDAGFLLEIDGHRKVHYLEQNRNTSGVRSIAASKTPGYEQMLATRQHQRHFPESNVDTFTVLLVTTQENRRNRLADGLADKPGEKLWKFAMQEHITAEHFPYEPVFRNTRGEMKGLVKRVSQPSEVA